MTYAMPTVELNKRESLVRDEWWPVIVILFVIWAYSQYSLNQAIKSCRSSGGVESVESKIFGMSWKVTCFKK